MAESYRPWRPARRPGGRPPFVPRYRVLVARRFEALWVALPDRVGLQSTQQFWDHVARRPGEKPAVNRAGLLKGRAGEPIAAGFSRTVHYEISGSGRLDYQFCDAFVGERGDPHRIVVILAINLGSH